CRADAVGGLFERLGELLAGGHGFGRIDAGLRDRLEPVALPVARRQGGRIETELAHRFLVPAHILEHAGQGPLPLYRRHRRAVLESDAPAYQYMEQAEEVPLRLSLFAQALQELA